nr:accessory Sec system protein Asp1 [Staphylococcus aureus]
MKYFIPAWYDDQQWWQDTTVPYYQMISLMGMHLENELDYHLIVLNHAPNIRTFLHRYDLYETKYWSVFDEIQGFSHHAPQAINYHLLKWPDDVEFVYTPYLLKCVTSEQAYTNIYFSQEGYSIWFEEFERDQLQRRYIFDDRGYLSAIRYFDKDGEASYQEYLTIDGDCVLCEDLKGGRVSVSKRARLIVDSVQLERELLTHQDHHQRQNSMIRITPFETRQSPNISSQLMETFIGVWIDGMSDADLQQMMQRLVDYITQEDYYRLILLTRHQNDIPMWLRECITSVNEEYQSKQNADVNVSALMTPEDQDDIIAVKTIHAEHDVVEALRTLRLVIDMSKEPDLYLQISAISAGIPQINGQQTDYVSDYDNGRIINTVDELEDALNYYLFYLKNWNYAYAYSLKLIDAYASKNIINQLDELIEGENNAT